VRLEVSGSGTKGSAAGLLHQSVKICKMRYVAGNENQGNISHVRVPQNLYMSSVPSLGLAIVLMKVK
jgi:hypothetical protein